jgi:hypothetical protein
MKLNLYNYFDFMIETKAPEESFEEYSTDWLYLRVIKFVEGEIYDFNKMDSLQT